MDEGLKVYPLVDSKIDLKVKLNLLQLQLSLLFTVFKKRFKSVIDAAIETAEM